MTNVLDHENFDTFRLDYYSTEISSEKNIADTLSHMTVQSITYDKINQLRHAKYFGTAENLKKHMSLHEKVLKRKFDIVLSAFENHLSGLGIAE